MGYFYIWEASGSRWLPMPKSSLCFSVALASNNLESLILRLLIIGTKSGPLRDRIVQATNSQNSIKSSELTARTILARELEAYCKKAPGDNRIYFERRLGQFSETGERVIEAWILRKEDFTKAFVAGVLQEPHNAIGYADSFMDGDKNIWPDNVPIELLYSCGYIAATIDFLFRNEKIPSELKPRRYHILSAILIKVWPTIHDDWEAYRLLDKSDVSGDGLRKKARDKAQVVTTSTLRNAVVVATCNKVSKALREHNADKGSPAALRNLTRAQTKTQVFTARFWQIYGGGRK